ncbi:MAG: M23 family metallopeptidase [Bacteroidia bacterium]|nr:M23 family metallopeptidase [Bacteroidia bacterium]
MNDETFEEKASLVLSPRRVFVFFVISTLLLIIGVIYLIAFTSLREYIPGYADINMRRNIVKMTYRTDSLINELEARDIYLHNLKAVLDGNIKDSISPEAIKSTDKKFERLEIKPSEEDLALRKQIEEEEKNSLTYTEKGVLKTGIASFFFFTPLQGLISDKFKASANHYGIDIVAPKNEAVKATLDGTVTLSDWSPETGHIIQLQHDENIISIYKHNSVLLKKAGDKVKAGEPIAIVGDAGELSTGPHLHFEIWYKGMPIDPQEYISF